MKPKRSCIMQGTVLTARQDNILVLNPHLMLLGASRPLPAGSKVTVASGPKRDKDGINLVQVRASDDQIYAIFYCDSLHNCEVA